ncbi:MAG: CDP-glycerol glycerophosphotransferase family protein [Prevotellaceae bacterium]|jgi:CDP-glycerol glycerophosphotransferase (TagB/SpsB family)|nr:CDP-glycerol glycerophosphotransferase family protein [Prevotellaceae bacterium]
MKSSTLKTIIYLIGYCLYPFSFLIPRSEKKWAFGSFRNAFGDNAKYLFLHLAEHHRGEEVAWISASRKTVQRVRRLGLQAYFIGSLRGLWFALRAKRWFFNAYTSDILFFASGSATCINLWHGIGGGKKIEFSTAKNSHGAMAERYVKKTLRQRFFYPQCYRRPDYVLSSTSFQSSLFAEAFRVPPSRCLNVGYPRNAILTAAEAARQRFISRYEPRQTKDIIDRIKKYRKTYIYMPTWRDSQREVFVNNINLGALNEKMKAAGSLFLLKPHANTIVDKAVVAGFENLLLVEGGVDIYPILPYTDVLVTDYSSVSCDYALMEGKDIILYLYDMEDYIREREFYYPFLDNVAGKVAYDFEELMSIIGANDYTVDLAKRDEILRKFWGNTAGKTLEEVSEDILRQVQGCGH